MLVRHLLVLVGVAWLLASAPPLRAQPASQSRSFRYIMGTSIRVEVYGGTEAARREATEEAFAALQEVDRLMSNYRDDSELSHINQRAGFAEVEATAPLLAVLNAAARVSRESDGAFDITVGPLVRLWGFKTRTPHVPSPQELAAIRDLVDYRNIRIDAARHTVRFTRPGVEIDLGGIAKGFAVELAAGSLQRRGLSGFIDAGGNQFMVGRPPGKSTWTVGITHPEKPGALLGALEVEGGSVSTSADSSNFLVAGGRRYGHLLDPRTLHPTEGALSVTIVSADGTLADALSKAVFVLGAKDGLALLDAFPDTSGLIAYRKPDGTVGLAMSAALRPHFHPASKTPPGVP